MTKSKGESIVGIKDFKRFWGILSANWYMFLIALLIGAGAAIYNIYTHPEELIAKMQISLKYDEKNEKDYTDYSEEMTGINAPSLINKTIESMEMDVSYFKKEGGLYKEVYDSVPFKIKTAVSNYALGKQYIRFTLLDKNKFRLNYVLNGVEVSEIGHFDSVFVNNDLRLSGIHKSKKQIPFFGDYYIKINNRNELVAACQSNLKTQLTNDLAVLQVTYKDMIPKRALAFLDTLSKAYLNNAVKNQLERNYKTVSGIDKLLTSTENILRNVEDSLRKYRRTAGLINSQLEDQKYLSMATGLLLDKKNLELQAISLKDIEQYIIENKDALGLPPPYYGDNGDAFIIKSLEELYQLQKTKKNQLFDVTDKGTNIDRLDKTYEDRKVDLLKYIRNSQKTIAQKMSYVEKQVAASTPVQQEFSKDQLMLMDLERQQKVNEAMFMSLLEKKNNLLVAQASIAPEYKLFESAHLISIGGMPKWKTFLIYIGISLTIALVIAYLKETIFERIESAESLKEKTQIPILGEMPMLTLNKNGLTSYKEAYKNPLASSLLRSMRTSLEFLFSGKTTKTILITSHNAAEGKTFSAINLASILAIANRKVLLIDLDLHKPNISNLLGLGFSTKNIGNVYSQTSSIQENIIHTEVKNLDAIIAENAMRDGSELILSEITKDIIKYGQEKYDYVIIDTPPVGLVSDAMHLMQLSDINLYILNAKASPDNPIIQATEIVEKNKFPIHFILNKVQLKKLQYYSKQYKNYKYAYAS